MIIIAGLGNPGKEYANTRHNVGFNTVDALAKKYDIEVTGKEHKALVGKGMIEGHKVILVKPQTYMNNSGESLRAVCDFYKPEVSTEVIVIYDDITLDVGSIRVRKKGSAGGHNGMKSIINHLGSENFYRIRVGIGEKPERMDLADWVLGNIPKSELEKMDEAIADAIAATVMMMDGEVDEAMNRFNKKVDRK